MKRKTARISAFTLAIRHIRTGGAGRYYVLPDSGPQGFKRRMHYIDYEHTKNQI